MAIPVKEDWHEAEKFVCVRDLAPTLLLGDYKPVVPKRTAKLFHRSRVVDQVTPRDEPAPAEFPPTAPTILASYESAPTRKPSPFLALPAELRNLIYLFALTPPDGTRTITVSRESTQRLFPLLLTNRQIRTETLAVLVRTFRFRLVTGAGQGAPAARWLDALPDTDRIQSFEIAFDAASTLRWRLAQKNRWALLERLSPYLASRSRDKCYEKSFELFVDDVCSVVSFLKKHLPPDAIFYRPVDRMQWRLMTPSRRRRAQRDEWLFMDRVERLLQYIRLARE